MVPSAARPDLSLLRAALALSSTATRASPLRVRGGITRDGALSTCRCAELVGEIGFLVAGGGEGPCTCPRARYPPHREGSSRDGWVWKGGGGLPVPPASPFPPCPPSRVRPSHARPRPGHSRGEAVSRVVRAACSRATAVAASSPPSTAAFPRPVEIAGALLPPLPPPRGSRGSVTRGGWPRSRGRTLIWGNRRSAASGASSDVGTRCRTGGLRRLASVSASALSRVGWRLLGLPGVVPLVSGRLGAAGVAGLLRVGCSVIPAGLARVPGRRPGGLPVPCEASPAGGAAAAGPAVDGPRPCRFAPPPRPPAVLSLSLLVRPTPRPCCRAPPHGGRPGAHVPRGGRGVPWGKGRPAGGEKLRFAGRPGLRGRGGVFSPGLLEAVCGGKVAPRGVKDEKRLSGCRPRRSVGPLAEGASAGGPSGPAVLWGGVRRGKLPGCQGGRLGVESNPCARPGVTCGGSGRCLSPSLPRGPASLLTRARPPSLPPRGVKVVRRPPPLLLHLSARGRRRRASAVGPVLFLRFSPGVGRRPVSRRPPLAWSPSRPFTVLRPRPSGSGVVSPSPRRCASLARVLGGGPAAAPARP